MKKARQPSPLPAGRVLAAQKVAVAPAAAHSRVGTAEVAKIVPRAVHRELAQVVALVRGDRARRRRGGLPGEVASDLRRDQI